MSGWLKGVVKEVPSGDTVVLRGAISNYAQPQSEKRIVLASLMAPKLGKRDGSSPDEEFASEAREALRASLIGKDVVFRVDYTVDQISMEFGSVMLGGQNVALDVVKRGHAKVREGKERSPYYDELKAAEEQAQAAGVGIWTKDHDKRQASIRDPMQQPDGKEYLERVGVGKPLPAVVEQVLNASTLRVTVPQDGVSLVVRCAGVQAPTVQVKDGKQPEAWGQEARQFTELKLLNREVRVALMTTDTFGNLFGSVFFEEGGEAVNLADQLAAEGCAKFVEWSSASLPNGRQLMFAVERAKAAKLGMWRGYVPPVTNSSRNSGSFSGQVIEIVSGDTLVVKDAASGEERRLSLASVRAPRMRGREDQKPEPYAVEAKELLRKRLIGKQVDVNMEYDRKIEGSSPPQTMSFGNVTFREKDQTGEVVDKTASQLVVSYGLASVTRHREGEERASQYEKLVEAEDFATKKKNGMHSSKAAPVHHTNDVSVQGSSARAKQYLSFLTRGKVAAVCSHVTQGHRLKLYVPKEGVTIAFSPAGVRCPARSQPARPGQAAQGGEPGGDEALAFTRQMLLQRDVSVAVETMDRGGTFLGSVTDPKGNDLGLALLQKGLARTHQFFEADRTSGGHAMLEAEAAARDAKKGLWAHYTPPAVKAAEQDAAAAAVAGRKECTLTVTEITDATRFYVQLEEEAASLEYVTKELATASPEAPTPSDGGGPAPGLGASGDNPIQQGASVYGRFVDGLWYRAYVEKIANPGRNAKYTLFFIDYGNSTTVGADAVRRAEAKVAAVPALAHLCCLAGVHAPELAAECGYEAASLLADLTRPGTDVKLAGAVEGSRRAAAGESHPRFAHGVKRVSLTQRAAEGEGEGESVAAALLEEGVVKLMKPTEVSTPHERELVAGLKAAEEKAREAHRGVWQYGDIDSDEEEGDFPSLGGRRR